MIQIPITNIPNQSLSIQLDGNQYDINIQSCQNDTVPSDGIMAFDIIRNGVAIITGTRAVAGFPLIPAKYLENGNFIVVTANDDLPDWHEFGISQYLIFASESELETLRGS